ncbi:hypothetical protein SteCoe_31212 [Stentor coeruleus]|uniref:Uncharacterized protein n=1 Tax=Stentor coeruleus TaxID=5963 RepID=A0A1R2B1W5_9CILI|nr:hypothetical protein SteCoe_31212 [Stentor coeruleus]
MILTLVFYLVVCGFFYQMWRKSSIEEKNLRKTYTRSDIMSQSCNGKLPDDWISVEEIKKHLNPVHVFKPQRYRQKPLQKAVIRVMDNKENEYPSKQSLTSFILKELESSVNELTKPVAQVKINQSLKASVLNPYAKEFILSNT